MSTEYWIIRVNYSQKVCYVILGDVPVFKAIKIVDEIRSYSEINNIDFSTSLFPVAFGAYQKWLCLLVSEDLIEINLSGNKVFDDSKLSTLKSHITSIKYELEIEPNATIQSYTCDISEIAENLFNEWFGDVHPDKQEESHDISISEVLYKLRDRIDEVLTLQKDYDKLKREIQERRDAIAELEFDLDKLGIDILNNESRIELLFKKARENGCC